MDTLQEIKQAIGSLAAPDLAELQEWMLAHGVREPPAPAYNIASADGHLSVEDYFALEEKSPLRHEYVAGEIFAMSGATVRHNLISANIAGELRSHLRGGPCKAFINDVKVRIKVADSEVIYYPDVMVACGELSQDENHVWHPTLVIEVLSPSTEMIDRREKALNYRQIPGLEEYVLVGQRVRHVTIFRRREGWRPEHMRWMESAVDLRSIQLSLPMAQIYEGVQ
jgi:Uma2 family endonuclease